MNNTDTVILGLADKCLQDQVRSVSEENEVSRFLQAALSEALGYRYI